MNTLKLIAGIAILAGASAVFSQTTQRLTGTAQDSTEAEVRKVDLAARKITLKHGEIKNLEMPPMTMVFQVPDPALLGGIKVGDKVRFTADKVNGAYTVLTLQPAK